MKYTVLLSGGVDSATALARFTRQNSDLKPYIEAVYLKIWLEDEFDSLFNCPWEEDLQYARATCELLDIPLHEINLQREYYQRVIAHTLDELRRGATPSPDLLCNSEIKFGVLMDHFVESDKVVTGHYASIQVKDSESELYCSADTHKDQTYFLSRLSREQLQSIEFPLADMTKPQVRSYAKELNLPSATRKDSQGICFLGKIPYGEFIKYHLGVKEGKIVSREDGSVLGRHQGYWFYTIGQRSGLKLGGGPWYVSGKDIQENTIFVTHQNSLAQARNTIVVLDDYNWFDPQMTARALQDHQALEVKLRHGALRISARFIDEHCLELARGDAGIAMGQYCVIYDGKKVLGSGRITGSRFARE